MNLTRNCPGFAALAVAALILAPMAALGQKVPLMTVDQLKARLGDGKTAIIDVRRPTNDPEGKIKIAGAVAEAWDKPSQWASKYDPERIIVLYCA